MLETRYGSEIEEWYAAQAVCKTVRADCAGFLTAHEEGRFKGTLRTLPFEEAKAYRCIVSDYRPSLENTRVLETSVFDEGEEVGVEIIYIGKGKHSPIAVVTPGKKRVRAIDSEEEAEIFVAVSKDMAHLYNRYEDETGIDCSFEIAVCKMWQVDWWSKIIKLVKEQSLTP